MFVITKQENLARRGEITTRHGSIQTPAYLPCATHGAVRGVPWQLLEEIGLEALLVNAYHVGLRPRVDRIAELGGLHKFIGWDKPILTDSGGFQAFALSKMAKYSEQGIEFRSHIDGQIIQLTPEQVVRDQERLGVDLATCLDVCTGFPVPESEVAKAVDQTNRWAQRSIAAWTDTGMALYGMVQGSIYQDQRRRSAEFLRELPFSGFAIGGNMYTFGKQINEIEREKQIMWDVVQYTTSLLPGDRPRHLLGVGEPSDIVAGVRAGIDTFDCVMATRLARHGAAWVRLQPGSWQYRRINVNTSDNSRDALPLDPLCSCSTCSGLYSKAYLAHLQKIGDPSAGSLLTIHNLTFLHELMVAIRTKLTQGSFDQSFSSNETLRQP